MSVQIIHGDSRAALEFMPSNSIDSVVTDPPYALVSISKRFGKDGAAPAKVGATGAYARASAGFMGKTWDTGETAFDPTFWAEVLRVLKPGGHVLAFGGTRTYHRLACSIEDAGFEIRDQIGWLYGSGFPKSHNQSGDWQGWGTALKPAWEPIVVARKWLDGTNAANLAKWGVGALNIDACRTQYASAEDMASATPQGRVTSGNLVGGGIDADRKEFARPELKGRWPANVIHDGSPEVLGAFPDAKGQQGYVGPEHGPKNSINTYGDFGARPPTPPRVELDKSAARFFYSSKASKADRGEGNNHPTVKPTDLMRYLCRLVTPPGGTVLDPFMGSGSTGRGAVMEGFSFIGCELDADYTAIARARIAAVTPAPTDGVFA